MAKIPQQAHAASSKETIYIDIDDEITSIIDKLKQSPHKIIALVLPKRATVLHSIVNMRLLKRAADQSRKNIVLITAEVGLLPLAGMVGIHVAKSLQSKPFMPPAPQQAGEMDDDMDETDVLVRGVATGAAPTGQATSQNAPGLTITNTTTDDDDETIEIDTTTDGAEAAKSTKPKKKFLSFGLGKMGGGHSLRGGKVKVPNFERFRIGIFVGIVVLVLLVVGWYMAFVSMPKARITIKTDSASIQSSIKFTASAATKTADVAAKQLPAEYKELKKTDTEKIQATGQKDIGQKATGSVSIINCSDNDVTVPAGTNFSTSGFSYATDVAVTVPASDFFSPGAGGACKKNGKANAAVTAGASGDKYNLSAGRDYTTPLSSAVTGVGSAMSGGTTQLVTVVGQADIDNAAAKMKGRLDDQAKDELRGLLSADGFMAINDMFIVGAVGLKSTPTVGEQATDITVTAETVYSLFGVRASDLSTLVKNDIDVQIDKKTQVILDDGVGSATYRIEERKKNDAATITMQTIVQAGPQLDAAKIAESVKGLKKGDTQKVIQARPGITDVTVEYSPFWVYTTPKSTKKITIIFDKPVTAKKSSTPNNGPAIP